MARIGKRDKIFVAGHRGLVGGEILRCLERRGYEHAIGRTRAELDLLDSRAVDDFFTRERPDVVFVAAAKVGGIHANNKYRADFIAENLRIQTNVIWSAHLANVKRLVFLGSSCIYPRDCDQPMREVALLTGGLEYTNRPYAVAKIAGLELVNALQLQYGRDFFSVMPTNLYGPRDNFHPENSHVVPALIRRFVEAVAVGAPEVVIWGTGRPQRELMYAADCADAVVHLAEELDQEMLAASDIGRAGWNHVNIGSGDEVTIAALAGLIGEAAGYKGRIRFDPSRPDGTPRKLLDTTFLQGIGWRRQVPLAEGLRATVAWYKEQQLLDAPAKGP